MLLIPGFMLDDDLWRNMQLERLGPELFNRVIHADTTRDDTLADMAERAIAALDGPALVVGFSMGGYIAREVAYRAPEKVAGLALVATSSRAHGPQPALPDHASFSQIGRSAVIRSLHPDHRSDALIQRVQAMSQRLGGAVFQRQSRLDRPDDTARLGTITCPTIVVAAAQDQLRTLEESRVLQAGISGSRLIVVEKSGHLIPIEQPDQLAGCIAELARAL